MATSISDSGSPLPPAERSPSANELWKKRWTRRVMVSTIIGAIAHLLVFVLLPMWEISAHLLPVRQAFVQIEPVLSGSGATVGDEGEAVPATPNLEELQIEVIEGGENGIDPTDERLLQMLDLLGVTTATVAQPVMRRSAYGQAAPPLPPLELEEVEILSPRLASPIASVALPIIRNPVTLQRFLRRRYNPLHQAPDGTGSVSVAMWINERGSVEWTAIEQSSGDMTIDEIALDLFNEVVSFSPARAQGVRVPVSVVISIPFTALW